MRKLFILFLLLTTACGAPKAVFRFGPASSQAIRKNIPASAVSGTDATSVPTLVRIPAERRDARLLSGLSIRRGTQSRASVRKVALAHRVVPTASALDTRHRCQPSHRKVGRHSTKGPTGGWKGPIWPIILGLAALLLGAISLVGILVAAVAGAAVLPWLVSLGVALLALGIAVLGS